MKNLVSIQEASKWASQHIGKHVTTSNISYLVQYGRIAKQGNGNGSIHIDIEELKKYYQKSPRKEVWLKKLGDDVIWDLSFDNFTESQTTKHVHRLHAYKGKFIPQLVEYFIGRHTDQFKKQVYFKAGDNLLDPFCGSGTTLVQANELGINAVGVDVSTFNAFISNAKLANYQLDQVLLASQEISSMLGEFKASSNISKFEIELIEKLKQYNHSHFPSPEYKYQIRNNLINEVAHSSKHHQEFLNIYKSLVKKYKIKLLQINCNTFLAKWLLQPIRDEVDFVAKQLDNIKEKAIKDILSLILSRTIRSCRATTHADLATLKDPISTSYYCKKHGKLCKPIFTIANWWKRYSQDTINRLAEFGELKTKTYQTCLVGDSRTINLKQKSKVAKFDGVFTSPPYVGLINYHEQHAYAYDLFGIKRQDELEIGPLFNGQGLKAQESYVNEIAKVLINSKKYLKPKANIFIVANDKYKLYPKIAELSKLKIVQEFKRPVLNRTEKSRGAYCETIFHMKN